jgi:hypothetical protein
VIRGWDGASNRDDVIGFLLRKFNIQVQNRRFEGQNLFVTAPDSEAYQILLRASGVRFAGKPLVFKPAFGSQGFESAGISHPPSSQPQSSQTSQTYQILVSVLSNRYDPSTGLLDLSSIRNDETLKSNGFFRNPSTFFKVPYRPSPYLTTDIPSVDESCI